MLGSSKLQVSLSCVRLILEGEALLFTPRSSVVSGFITS